jgi:hypothetical protein
LGILVREPNIIPATETAIRSPVNVDAFFAVVAKKYDVIDLFASIGKIYLRFRHQ